MNILWFSGRKMADLCSTTQKSLAAGLVDKGHKLTFINPDDEGTHSAYPWIHQSISSSSIPGLKSTSLAKNMRKWLEKNPPPESSVAILDWRVASSLTKTLNSQSTPWILIDRSPPADDNILAKLQWYFWKRAWNLVRTEGKIGCVVSDSHREFVANHTNLSKQSIIIIPAGVDTQQFTIGVKSMPIKLCYHGRLDSNRDILSLVEIHSKLSDLGVDTELYLHGSGNLYSKLSSYENGNIYLTESLDIDTLSNALTSYDVGFLPMPDQKIWRLASPLKRAEYLASGMIVVGTNHSGHQIEESGDWLVLFNEQTYIQDSVRYIQNLAYDKLNQLQIEARQYAIEKLDWSQSVEILHGILSKQS